MIEKYSDMEDVSEYNRYEVAEGNSGKGRELEPLFEYLELSIKTSKSSESVSTIIDILKSGKVSPAESYLIMKKIISETDYYSHIFQVLLTIFLRLILQGTSYQSLLFQQLIKLVIVLITMHMNCIFF